MADFYATYSASAASSSTVTALQGTVPWVVAGNGTAGASAAGVLSVQGIASGTPVPISGSITATNPSVSATGAAVPTDATFIGGSDGTNLRAVKVSAAGVVSVDGSATTQPISGTVAVSNFPATQPVSGTVAATQSGTWTVQPGNTANTTPWLSTIQGDGSTNKVQVSPLGEMYVVGQMIITDGVDQAQVTAAGALKVDASSSTQPVSGTVAATQSGTWTVQPGNTANTTAWKVDGSAVTQPVSTATTTAAFQAEGAVAFGSITNSYATAFTPAAGTKILQLRNNTNASVSVSFDGGSTTNYTLDSGDQVSLDLRSNLLLMSTTAIQIKYAVGAPTSGSFRINGGG